MEYLQSVVNRAPGNQNISDWLKKLVVLEKAREICQSEKKRPKKSANPEQPSTLWSLCITFDATDGADKLKSANVILVIAEILKLERKKIPNPTDKQLEAYEENLRIKNLKDLQEILIEQLNQEKTKLLEAFCADMMDVITTEDLTVGNVGEGGVFYVDVWNKPRCFTTTSTETTLQYSIKHLNFLHMNNKTANNIMDQCVKNKKCESNIRIGSIAQDVNGSGTVLHYITYEGLQQIEAAKKEIDELKTLKDLQNYNLGKNFEGEVRVRVRSHLNAKMVEQKAERIRQEHKEQQEAERLRKEHKEQQEAERLRKEQEDLGESSELLKARVDNIFAKEQLTVDQRSGQLALVEKDAVDHPKLGAEIKEYILLKSINALLDKDARSNFLADDRLATEVGSPTWTQLEAEVKLKLKIKSWSKEYPWGVVKGSWRNGYYYSTEEPKVGDKKICRCVEAKWDTKSLLCSWEEVVKAGEAPVVKVSYTGMLSQKHTVTHVDNKKYPDGVTQKQASEWEAECENQLNQNK